MREYIYSCCMAAVQCTHSKEDCRLQDSKHPFFLIVGRGPNFLSRNHMHSSWGSWKILDLGNTALVSLSFRVREIICFLSCQCDIREFIVC